MRTISFLIILLFFGCAEPVRKSVNLELISPKFEPAISFSQDSIYATITVDRELTNLDSLSKLAQAPLSIGKIVNMALPTMHDSTVGLFTEIISEVMSIDQRQRSFRKASEKDGQYVFHFTLDTTGVLPMIRKTIEHYRLSRPLHYLFDRQGVLPGFMEMTPKVLLQFPCTGIPVPTQASRLPNAPRPHRSGIHRGVDFQSNWGTPVLAVADGIVIRSDQNYKEIKTEFLDTMLHLAGQLNRTPSDIFNELLLGQAVIIDHGFGLFTNFRAISVYAHLSHIDSNIQPGYSIKAGEVFGKSGNSGTRSGTLGNRGESHLHWELVLQDNQGEYFFGQDLDYDELITAYNRLFSN